ncbi:sulfur carrier protein ThiS [Thermocrinis sp.]
MKIYLNGEETDVPEGITLAKLIELKGIKIREVGFAVSVNEEVVPKSKYEEYILSEGDKVEIVHIVGGG